MAVTAGRALASLLFASSFLTISCAIYNPPAPKASDANQVPEWVLKVPTQSDKICSVGSCAPTFYAETAKPCAADNAREALVKAVSVKIQSIMVDENSSNGRNSVESASVHSVTGTTSDMVLEGSVIESYWYDSAGKVSQGVTYALACIPKAKAGVK
jgi:hypothetical protein